MTRSVVVVGLNILNMHSLDNWLNETEIGGNDLVQLGGRTYNYLMQNICIKTMHFEIVNAIDSMFE